MKGKKGAIELSMTTIIVVIIGITLLSLGLVWINSTFGNIGDLTDQSFLAAKKAIQEGMAPDDTFFISGTSYDASPGKKVEIYSGVQYLNVDPDAIATITITASSSSSSVRINEWFPTLPTSISLTAGDQEAIPIALRIPKNFPKGEIVSVTIKAQITDNSGSRLHGQEIILIEVV